LTGGVTGTVLNKNWLAHVNSEFLGAPHLRSSARDLNFYQYHSLDVISFLCIVGLLSVWGIFTSISCLTRRICKVKVADGSRETKQLILNSTNANATKKIRNSTKKQQ